VYKLTRGVYEEVSSSQKPERSFLPFLGSDDAFPGNEVKALPESTYSGLLLDGRRTPVKNEHRPEMLEVVGNKLT
jgi:hypothetical protein